MAQHLNKLLGISDSAIHDVFQKLENATGQTGVDVRLSAEIIGKNQLTLKSLGLDPKDSNEKEVYAGLCAYIKKHDEFIAKHINHNQSDDATKILKNVHHYVQKLNIPKQVWVAKHSVIKRLLKEKPPRRSMKKLGYRSVESMLKREPVVHVLAVAMHMESDAWMRRYYEQYNGLMPTDFEERAISFHLPSSRYWGELGLSLSSKLQSNIVNVKELGAVVLLPLPQKNWTALHLALLTLTLIAMQELRIYSSYFKLQQMEQSFGEKIALAVTDRDSMQKKVSDISVHWRVLHNHFANIDPVEHPEFFEPHLTVEDFAFRKVEDILMNIEPALSFWHGKEYAGFLFDGASRPVSFNLLDGIINCSNNLSCEQRTTANMQSALWDEILFRYIGQGSHVRSQLLRELAGGSIELHDFTVSSTGGR